MKMNPTVSNTIFHFTGIDHDRGKFKPDEDSFGTIKSILSSKHFRLSRCPRDWSIFDTEEPLRDMDFKIPMVCFTETPIEYISMHMKTFGYFGLGMNVDWAIRNKAQNVIYCHKDEPGFYGRTLAGVLDFIHHSLVVDPNTQAKWYWFRSLVGITEDIIYRDERELRIIGRSENVPGGGTEFEPKVVDFQYEDVECIVCPKAFLDRLKNEISNLEGFNVDKVKIIISEELLEN